MGPREALFVKLLWPLVTKKMCAHAHTLETVSSRQLAAWLRWQGLAQWSTWSIEKVIFAVLELWLCRPYSECEPSQFLPIILRTYEKVARVIGLWSFRTFSKMIHFATCKHNWCNITSNIFWLAVENAYTVSQKASNLMFVNNFGKCGTIFKNLSPLDSSENSLHRVQKKRCHWFFAVTFTNIDGVS